MTPPSVETAESAERRPGMGKALKTRRQRCWELYEKYYADGRYQHHVARYRDEIGRRLGPNVRLLDAGCGARLEFTKEFAPRVGQAIGFDIDPIQTLAEGVCAVQADATALPFRSGSMDVIISMSVVEHLPDPANSFAEYARVLRPGGALIMQTPNRYDYVSLIAAATPFWFHQRVLPKLQTRQAADAFPTLFRANTRRRLAHLLRRAGFGAVDITLLNQYPSYLMFSPLAFRLGVLYERVTSRFDGLAQLRGWLLAVARKDGDGAPAGGGA
jgi:SAM-dependent methyltransferase